MDVLAEKILLVLKNIFKKDPLIDEFDILPVEKSLSNKCPVLCVDHKVALEKWCVKHVYIYAYSKFFAWRKGQNKSSEIVESESLISWTSALLLINPDLDTAWNVRKEMVQQGALLPSDELRFSEVVLSRKPKSSPVYAHRQWVLKNCNVTISLDTEFSLCNRWAHLYRSNYYAWGHRLWVLKHLGHNEPQIIQGELTLTEFWVAMHVSDHCGWHYRQQLIGALNPSTALLQKELDLCTEFQRIYPGHEALWVHRRFLLWASRNQHVRSPSERKRFDPTNCAENSSDCNWVPCIVNDKIKIKLDNITYSCNKDVVIKMSFDGPDLEENGLIHNGKHLLDCNGISHTLHSEIVQCTSKSEVLSLDEKNGLVVNAEPLDCNGELASSCVHGQNCFEEIVMREMDFVRERQDAAQNWPWESLLLQRHVKWVSDVVGWKLLQNR